MNFKDFFYIRKGDRSAILILLAVAVVSLALIFALGGKNSSNPEAVPFMSGRHPSADSAQSSKPQYYAVEGQKAERFAFDPNTADSTQLLRLGLQPWQVRNIYKYRAHGGVYRQPSDFARLYGLTQKQFRELEPYIRISSDYRPAAELVRKGDYQQYEPAANGHGAQPYNATSTSPDQGERSAATSGQQPATDLARVGYPKKLKAGEFVVLNIADTTALRSVPGIGPYYARRIVNYGNRLGGYTHVSQLLEIEGFPEDALPYFQVDAGNVRKLNVNKLSLSKLRQHPYLNFYQARAICDYRRLKGPLHSLDDLKMLPEFPADVIARLRPYVSFE